MPRYFFHTRIGDALLTDEEGVELHDPDHAWRVARATIRESLSEEPDTSRLITASLIVADASGETVFEFPFSEAVDTPPEGDDTLH
ncbi:MULTISPECIES: DUF6894 family protein [Methylorubrum]|jgi:hypothetical protein|uniref:DUF6894 domain-containing protein n=1 Tax=Methylorubrum suomiense TaxID=144191 RepID=A0ABQ4UNR9_9HYPH|nr:MULTISPECIES: hypothetical protein [Methylobacteriaceae]GJE73759.1 hypothetical protein BGCPKDLD_0326 [Methylorubrum suomiense]